ncbi:hypothetical protein [Winogradskyella bathintestinalis]|uniref:Uncharacterized protein n=1 Tax=Winogradskyella bathintestinalis TaxID=3035208 RepID=A0ABT7ZRX1_9FLAO|nr:hypothetical protein [Winogradskyella bathintestinalis]MDN3491713.1 hypothetical protein [Winogradskyella bathintestinalis]
MKTKLNEALTELKLSHMDFRPSLKEVLNELKTKEINCVSTKVISDIKSTIKDSTHKS